MSSLLGIPLALLIVLSTAGSGVAYVAIAATSHNNHSNNADHSSGQSNHEDKQSKSSGNTNHDNESKAKGKSEDKDHSQGSQNSKDKEKDKSDKDNKKKDVDHEKHKNQNNTTRTEQPVPTNNSSIVGNQTAKEQPSLSDQYCIATKPSHSVGYTTEYSIGKQTAISDYGLYSTWQDGSNDNSVAAFETSYNSGVGMVLSNTTFLAYWPSIAALPDPNQKSDNVYVAWEAAARNGSPLGIEFRASHDSGHTFCAPIMLTRTILPVGNTTTASQSLNPPHIAALGTNVYVVWNDGYDVYIRVSHDKGQSFEPTVIIASIPFTSPNTTGVLSGPRIATADNNVYVTWERGYTAFEQGNNAFIRISHDNGTTFNEQINLSNSGNSSSAWLPQVFATGKDVYVTWIELSGQSQQGASAKFVASTDTGITFAAPISLGHILPYSTAVPTITASGHSVTITWKDESHILSRDSNDDGATFEPVDILGQFISN